jgi:hypothetical protein
MTGGSILDFKRRRCIVDPNNQGRDHATNSSHFGQITPPSWPAKAGHPRLSGGSAT